MKKIDSRENPAFRRIDRIRRHTGASDEGILFLEGMRLCQDAVLSGVTVHQLILTQEALARPEVQVLSQLVQPADETLLLSDRLFALLAATERPQGVAMLCGRPQVQPEQQTSKPNGLYLVLEGIADPGNVGTLIRTADAFAFDGVVILPQTASPFNDKAIRSSMGSCFHLPVIKMPDLDSVRRYLDEAGLALYAADLSGISVHTAPFTRPGALLIGNEAHGISRQARDICDQLVHIPIPGQSESLNAAVAGGILCYEMRKAFSCD